MNYYLYIIIHLTILTTTSAYPLEWEFQTFPTQPDTGFVASLLLSNPSQGKIVAFENDDGGSITKSSTGTTWQASTIPADLPISKGGRLIWVRFNLTFGCSTAINDVSLLSSSFHSLKMTCTNVSFSLSLVAIFFISSSSIIVIYFIVI